MNTFIAIGEFQLRNLLANRVRFFYYDLRVEHSSATPDHALLEGSQRATASEILDVVREAGIPADGPIVLICENGLNSMAAAHTLAQNSFINVFVVDGGVKAL